MDSLSRVMNRCLLGVSPDTTVAEAAQLATRYDVEHLLVLEGDDLVGMLDTRELENVPREAPVFDHMRAPVRTISANSSVREAAELMNRWAVQCLPVVAGGLLLGVVTRDRLLPHLEASAS
jgi:CBS domain-containing protein